jgi:hypothetical protein
MKLFLFAISWLYHPQKPSISCPYPFPPKINIDYYMAFFISYPLSAREPIGSRDDI